MELITTDDILVKTPEDVLDFIASENIISIHILNENYRYSGMQYRLVKSLETNLQIYCPIYTKGALAQDPYTRSQHYLELFQLLSSCGCFCLSYSDRDLHRPESLFTLKRNIGRLFFNDDNFTYRITSFIEMDIFGNSLIEIYKYKDDINHTVDRLITHMDILKDEITKFSTEMKLSFIMVNEEYQDYFIDFI